MSGKNWKLLLKIAISVLCIAFLFCSSDVTETLKFLAGSNHIIWMAGILLYLAGQVVCAYKWKLLAQEANFAGSVKDYIDYYFTGMFFNLFLPTTVGGDAIKCYYLSKNDAENRKAAAIYSVLADRITGVIVLVWLAAAVIFLPVCASVPAVIKAFILLMAIGAAGFSVLFPVLCNIFANKKWIGKFFTDISIYWQNHALIAKALGLSLVFHLLIIFIHVLIGYAIGTRIPVLYYFIIYPMTSLAGFLPVSFNGIGPREATYIYFLALVGIKSSVALAFGIFWFGIVLITSLMGGVFYLKHAGLKNEKDEFSTV